MTAGQPLRGLVGQHMAAKKDYSGARISFLTAVDITAGSGSFTAKAVCQALVYLIGPGGCGGGANSNVGSGGGGGAALFKRIRLRPGDVLAWTCGAAGTPGVDATDTTISVNGAVSATAGGGKSAPGTANVVMPGGIAIGGDINRPGGAGGTGTGGSTGTPGIDAGVGGGVGGAGGSGFGGGGAGAGFGDVLAELQGGNGAASATSLAGGANGGASGGNAILGNGGAGHVYMVVVRAQ